MKSCRSSEGGMMSLLKGRSSRRLSPCLPDGNTGIEICVHGMALTQSGLAGSERKMGICQNSVRSWRVGSAVAEKGVQHCLFTNDKITRSGKKKE